MAFGKTTKKRTILGLLILWALLGLNTTLTAQEDEPMYLYYFESDDARLIETTSKTYAFATLPNEKVTIVVYGLDSLIQPKLTIFNRDGQAIGQGTYPEEQPNVTFFQFGASTNDLFTFKVERNDGVGGLARVMLFEGDPLDQDLTLLDDMNPLLPSRAFMVAGRDDQDGLRVLVEVLDVPYYNQKPEVFASRGTLTEIPTPTERFSPADTFLWFNKEGKKIYFVNIRPTPEDTTVVTQNISFRAFNVGGFFYFDYYFTVGAGSDPIRLVNRQECANASNRLDCVRSSTNFGRTEDGKSGDFNPENPLQLRRDELPPIQACVITGITATLITPGVLVGSQCDDVLTGSAGNDTLAGGPGLDILKGGAGDDLIFGDEDTDFLDGGLGNDSLDGGIGVDEVTYIQSTAGVTVDLTNTGTVAGGTATGYGNDKLYNIENVQGSNQNDTLTGSSGNNVLYGNDGDDTFDGNGGNDLIYGGSGNDLVIIDQAGNVQVDGGYTQLGDDTVRFYDTASGNVVFNDWAGNDLLDFSNVTVSGVNFDIALLGVQNVYGSVTVQLFFDDLNGILGTNQNDVLGGSNNFKNCDDIDASGGDDLVYASSSNGFDCVAPYVGIDSLNGGTGNDTISYERLNFAVSVNLNAGTANKGFNGNDVLLGFENAIGSNFDDTVVGTAASNLIDARNGNNIISADDGDNTIIAGTGSDTVTAGTGNDTVTVGDGNNSVNAGDGANTITSGVGNDTIISGADNDTITAGDGNNLINAGDGVNTVSTGIGSDTITTGAGIDSIVSGDGNDNIDAGGGDDTILAGLGIDTVNGGAGVDLIDYSAETAGILAYLDGILAGSDSLVGIENLDGTNLGDAVIGNNLANIINSNNGNDYYSVGTGAYGNDVLDSGAGVDSLVVASSAAPSTVNVNANNGSVTNADGSVNFSNTESITTGSGNDTFNVANGLCNGCPVVTMLDANALQLNGGTGTNTYNFANVGQGYILLTPNITDTLLVGGASSPIFQGTDTVNWQELVTGLFVKLTSIINPNCLTSGVTNFVNGSAGNDNLGGAPLNLTSCASDEVFNGQAGNDTVTYETVTLGADILRYQVTTSGGGVAIVNRIGGTLIGTDSLQNIETIVGNNGSDLFEFYDTAPTALNLDGRGLGNDSLDFRNVTAGNPVTLFMWNTGTSQTVYGAFSLNLLNQVRNVVGGQGNDYIEGTGNADNISGFSGNDEIYGFNGDDTLNDIDGGQDSLYGDAGNDSFNVVTDGASDNYSGGANTDVLTYTGATAIVGNFPLVGANVLNAGTEGAGGDTLSGFETLNTDTGNDTFTLNNSQLLLLNTNGGDDQVTATGSTTSVNLGAGNDTLTKGSVNAVTYDGGIGVNVYNYTGASIASTINGINATVSTDSLLNFQSYNFGAGNDTITVASDTGVTAISTGDGVNSLSVNADTSATTLVGGASTDTLTYTLVADLVATLGATNTVGNDTFSAFETVNLGNGNNAITVNGGTDVTTLNSGIGNDTLTVNNDGAVNTVNLGTGNNTFNVNSVTAVNNTYTGGGANDVATYGTATALTVDLGATDTITGGGGIDTLVGIETLTSGTGNDTLNITDGTGFVSINANTGNDVLNITNAGTATVGGGGGNDTFNVTWDATNNTFDGEGNTDTADYSTSAVALNATVNGTSTTLNSGLVTDTIQNFETITLGGAGDTASVTDDSALTTLNLGGGNDVVTINADTVGNTFNGDAGTDTFTNASVAGVNATVGATNTVGNDTITTFENVTLGNGNNNITLNGATDVVNVTSGSGDDTLTVSNDTSTVGVDLGTGNNTFNVNAVNGANNTYTGGVGTDTVTYNAALGAQLVAIGATDTVTDNGSGFVDTLVNVEVLTLGGGADTLNITDTTGFTSIAGGGGGDTFNVTWDAVNSALNGGTGANIADYSGSGTALTVNVNNTTTTLTNGTTDTIQNFQTITLGSGGDTVTITDDSALTALNLGGGNDVVTINSDTAGDTFSGGLGNDTFTNASAAGVNATVGATNTVGNDTITTFEEVTLGNGNNNITLNGATDVVNVTSGSGDDTLTVSNDTSTVGVDLGTGDNTFNVNAVTGANNTYTGGVGTDTVTYNAAVGAQLVAIGATDTVTDNGSGFVDTLVNVEVLTLGGGADTLNITDTTGFTTISGGGGGDTFNVTWDAVNSALDGGTGTNIADYSTTVTALTGTVTGATTTLTNVTTDTIQNFQSILLGGGADDITVANDGTITNLNLGAGDDTLTVSSDTANTTYVGGADNDTFTNASATGLTVAVGATNTIGNDTLSQFETVNLGNGANAITVNGVTDIATVNSGTGNDTLTVANDASTVAVDLGNGNNTFNVNAVTGANNTFTGGTGTDTVTYNGAVGAQLVAIGATDTVTDNGSGFVDTLVNVEVLTLGGGADVLNITDTTGFTNVASAAGNDTFNVTWDAVNSAFDGGNNTDTADYSTNTDNVIVNVVSATQTTLTFGGVTDTLNNFETLLLGNGASAITVNNISGLTSLDAGAGVDSLTVAGAAVTANLAATNTVGTMTLSGVDSLTLTGNADTATINNPTGVTSLNTGAGNDTLNVTNAGTLTSITGGGGNDSFNITADANNNTFDGGANSDIANYTVATATVNVGANVTVAGGGGTDTLTTFEQVNTGAGNDTFIFDLSAITSSFAVNAGGSTTGNLFRFTGAPTGTGTIDIFTSSGGNDTLDFSGLGGATGVTLDMSNTASAQTVGSIQIWLHNIISNIIGSNNADTILGTTGADNIDGGAGADSLIGGTGTDTLVGGTGNDTLIGGVQATCAASGCTVNGGTDGADTLQGGIGNDSIVGGADLNCSAAGTTDANGADGADSIQGGEGNDAILGDNKVGTNCDNDNTTGGADNIIGGSVNVGATVVTDGNDNIDGQNGNDTIYGGNNNTAVTAAGGNDGSDTIQGGPGVDSIYGGNNNVGAGANGGNDGNDSIDIANNGNDTAFGGNNNAGATGTDPGVNTINSSGGDTSTQGNNP